MQDTVENINIMIEHWRIWHTFQDCQFIITELHKTDNTAKADLKGYIYYSDKLLDKEYQANLMIIKILKELELIIYRANGTFGLCYDAVKPNFTYWDALGHNI